MTASDLKLKKVIQEALTEVFDKGLLVGRLAYTFAEAGKLLGRSTRTVARMVVAGQLHPVTISGARLISAAELARVCTPKGENRRQARAGRTRAADPRKVAAGIDAMLRRQR